MELSRRTWNAAVKLAVTISIVAALAAIVVSAAGDVPQVAIVLTVIAVAFTASWVQSGRIRHDQVVTARRLPLRENSLHRS